MTKVLTTVRKESSGKRSHNVRKTITLDGDLADEVSFFVLETGSSERIVINNLIRVGLIHEKKQAEQKTSEFSLPSFSKGIGGLPRQELNTIVDEI